MNQSFGTGGSQGGNLLGLPTPASTQPNLNPTLDPRSSMVTSDYTKVPTSNYNPYSPQGQGSNQPYAPNFSQSKGLMAGGQKPQQGILGNINQFMMNPSTAMAIGLLQPTKGGSIGEALGGGYQNLMAQNLMNQKLQQQKFANLLGVGNLMAQLGKPSNIQYMQDKDGKTYAVGMVGNKMVDVSTNQPIDISNLTKIQTPAAMINMGSSDPGVKAFFDTFTKMNEDRSSAPVISELGSLDKMRRMLPDVYTGLLGGVQETFVNFAAALDDVSGKLGFNTNLADADARQRLAATRDYVQELARAGLRAREMLKGQGTITDQEVAALNQAVQAPQNMTPESIQAVLTSLNKIAFAKSYEDRKAFEDLKSLTMGAPDEYSQRMNAMIDYKLNQLKLPREMEERYQIWLRNRDDLRR